MLIAFDPVVLNLGPLGVRWFGVLALAGLGLAIWRSLRALDHERLPTRTALDALAWGLPAALISARVVHVLGWWDYYLTHASELWQLNLDGLSLWGGVLGGGLIGFVRLGSSGDPQQRRRILDVVAPNIGVGIAVGRLGAFLDGHGQGVPSGLPWATQYASRLAATPDFGVPRHPAQLYDAVVALGLGVLVSALPRRWPAGSRAAMFLGLYSLARLMLGAVRLDPSFLFGLQIEQILALGGIAFGLAYGMRSVLVARRHAPGGAATLYTKPGCHLCEVALSDLEGLRSRYPHTLTVVDISADDDLVRQYWDRIPVLHVGGRDYDVPLTPAVLQRALQASVEQDRAGANPTPDAGAPAKADHTAALGRAEYR